MTHVLRILLFAASVGLFPAARPVGAIDVATLLPFVDEQTAVVFRIEPARLPLEFRERIGGASGFLPATVRGQLRRVVQSPRIAQAFVVASLGDLPEQIPFVVFDRPDGWTEADSIALVEQTEFEVSAIGNAVVVALPRVMERLREVTPNPTRDVVREAFTESPGGPFQLAITLNKDQRRVIEDLWQPLLDRYFPIDARVLANIEWAVASVSDTDRWSVDLTAQSTGEDSAAASWASIEKGLPGVLQLTSIKRQETQPNRVKTRLDLSAKWVTGTLDSWVESAKLRSAKRNLGRIALGMHNYHSAYRRLPSAASKDPAGKPLLSWRVQVLAFLGKKEQKLFQRFHMDEPWDSPNNRPLIKEMPDVFRIDPTATPDGRSTIAIPVGESMVFHNDQPKFRDIIDGLSNTIMLVEVPEDRGEVWTKPGGGVSVDPGDSAAGIGGHFGNKVLVAWGDGTVWMADLTKNRESLYPMFTRNGKEVFRRISD